MLPTEHGEKPEKCREEEAKPGSGPTLIGLHDRIKSVSANGKKYVDVDILEMSECHRYVKIYARLSFAHWSDCMRTLWVKASDCVMKSPRRKKKGRA